MKILVVIPHHTLLRPEGHWRRLSEVLKLFPEYELLFLIPEGADETVLKEFQKQPASRFQEPGIGRFRIPYFLDWSRSFQSRVEEVISNCGVEMILFSFPWGLSGFKKRNEKPPCIYFSHGVERDFVSITLRHLGLNIAPLRFLLQTVIGAIEGGAVHRAALTAAISPRDVARFRTLYSPGEEKLQFVPQPIERSEGGPRMQTARESLGLSTERTVVIFHGSKGHEPNRTAVEILSRRIAPVLHKKAPTIQLVIAGPGWEQFQKDNILSLGFVPEIAYLLAAADLAVVPLQHACGTQMKMLDYLAAGVPIVCTEHAVRGLGEGGEEAALVRRSPSRLADGIIELAADDNAQEGLRQAGFSYLQRTHAPEAVKSRLNSLLHQIMVDSSVGTGTDCKPHQLRPHRSTSEV